MATILFSSTAGVYRGNLDGHSTHSDGLNSPADVVRLYRAAGYDFTCLSEHYWSIPRFGATTLNDASSLNQDDFITILSAELHCRGKLHDKDGLWHIVANGLPQDFAMANEAETGPELVMRAVEAGAYVTIAHPEWYSLTEQEAQALAQRALTVSRSTITPRPLMPGVAAARRLSIFSCIMGFGPTSPPPTIRTTFRVTPSAVGSWWRRKA